MGNLRLQPPIDGHAKSKSSLHLGGAAMLAFQPSVRGVDRPTAHAWRPAKRIDRLRESIVARRDSLADIALATGFTDQPHFNSAFTRAVGPPAGKWRRGLTTLAA